MEEIKLNSKVSDKLSKFKSAIASGNKISAGEYEKELLTLRLEPHATEFFIKLRALKNKAFAHVEGQNSLCGIFEKYPIDKNIKRIAEGGKRFENVKSITNDDCPLVTIITVVFNNFATVRKCIESVLNQTYPNIEYIVIDGASNDGTIDCINDYRSELDYYISENDTGIYNAMNKGLRLAKGEYIAFLNADDYYLTEAVELSVNNIIKNELDISYAGFYYADEDGVVIVADEAKPWQEALLVEGVPGGHETLFISKRCYNELNGYDESYRLAADYHLFVRSFFAGYSAAPLQRNILVMMPGGTSFNEEVGLSENRRVLEFCFGELSQDFFEFLYGLKYYKNWHGYPFDDKAIDYYLSVASKKSPLLAKAMFQSIENRKRPLVGRVLPKVKNKGDKLKICIALNYLTNASGGAERIAIETANKLHEEGHAVTVVQCFGLAGEPYYRLNPGIPVIDLAVFPYKNEYLMPADEIDISFERYGGREFVKLGFKPSAEDFDKWKKSPHFWRSQIYAGFYHHHKFDVVVSHMPSTYTYVLLPRKENDKTLHIASLHNSPEFKFYSPLYPAESKMERYMRLVALENADKIGVLFDEFTLQMPQEFQGKCFVLPNFLSDSLLNVADKNELKVATNKRVILSVGRLSEQKDHVTLIKAYAKVKSKLSGWVLKIYGEGPLQQNLEKCCIEQGLKPNEILIGARKDIHNIYLTGDIFAFPSLFEGFGLTALEAMSFGLPVIAFENCEGVRNLVNNESTGLLIEEKDRISSMANALIKLCNNNDLIKQLSEQAKVDARKYVLPTYIDAFYSVVQNYLKETGQPLLPVTFQNRKVKYGILTTYTEGGAGIAAVRLAKGLRNQGTDVSVISFSPRLHDSDYKLELQLDQQKLYERSLLLDKHHTLPGSTFFSNHLYPSLSCSQVDFLRNFDVINLHWVQMFLSIEVIEYILSFGKKVIWTLHDMAPFTGGCHYSNGCLGYTNDCSSCPQLSEAKKDYPSQILHEKMKRWQGNNLTIVSPSQWLADCAKQSQVFRDMPIKVIRNGLDVNIFKPTGKAHARNFFKLPQDKKILLFTCQSHGERRKGFKELMEIAHSLADQRSDFHILMFGHESEEIKKLPIPYTALGHIDEEWKLAVGYSAADVTLLPTLEDNLPNVILESVACGTPLVAFNSGGVSDAVIDGLTGKIVKTGDVHGFANAVTQLLDSPISPEVLKATTEHKWLNTDQATMYMDLRDKNEK